MPALISVKDAISQASQEIGISQRPISSAVGTNDQDIAQMLALLSLVADEVLNEEPYKVTLGDGYWILDGTTLELKAAITADSDLIAFEPRLAIDGLKYRFLKAKGLEFGEELRDFVSRLNKVAARVNGRLLDLDAAAGSGEYGATPQGWVNGWQGGRVQ
jgi:hypothetical protein